MRQSNKTTSTRTTGDGSRYHGTYDERVRRMQAAGEDVLGQPRDASTIPTDPVREQVATLNERTVGRVRLTIKPTRERVKNNRTGSIRRPSPGHGLATLAEYSKLNHAQRRKLARAKLQPDYAGRGLPSRRVQRDPATEGEGIGTSRRLGLGRAKSASPNAATANGPSCYDHDYTGGNMQD